MHTGSAAAGHATAPAAARHSASSQQQSCRQSQQIAGLTAMYSRRVPQQRALLAGAGVAQQQQQGRRRQRWRCPPGCPPCGGGWRGGGGRAVVNAAESDEEDDAGGSGDECGEEKEGEEAVYNDNFVRTTKYTVVTFLPLSMLSQFKRLANVYFLLVAILQSIPAISPLSPITAILPLVFVVTLSMLRDGIEDYYRWQSDHTVNAKRTQRWDRDSKTFVDTEWQALRVGDLVRVRDREHIPADLLLVTSSADAGVCYVDTMNLDGETNLKRRAAHTDSVFFQKNTDAQMEQVLDDVHFYCEPPHGDLYSFNGVLYVGADVQVPLDNQQLLLRGAQLRNTPWALGIVAYAGFDSKEMLNAKDAAFKQSNIERLVNLLIVGIFGTQVALSLIAAIIGGIWVRDDARDHDYVQCQKYQDCNAANTATLQFWTYMVLLNTLIPSSLIVTMEIVKVVQALFIRADGDMVYGEDEFGAPKGATVRSVTLNEELGQVEYVLSDKTGTLTENRMDFSMCSVAGAVYGRPTASMQAVAKRTQAKGLGDGDHHNKEEEEEANIGNKRTDGRRALREGDSKDSVDYLRATEEEQKSGTNKGLLHSQQSLHHFMPEVQSMTTLGDKATLHPSGPADVFLTMMTICNTVLTEVLPNGDRELTSDSPDEIALAQGAAQSGYDFGERRGPLVEVTLGHNQAPCMYEVLQIIPFTSSRKRMSVICRRCPVEGDVREDGKAYDIVVFCKGADNVILSRCAAVSLNARPDAAGIAVTNVFRQRAALPQDDELVLRRRSNSFANVGQQPGEATQDLRTVTNEHLRFFAQHGLRTLVFGFRVLEDDFFTEWQGRYRAAELLPPVERSAQMEDLSAEVESELMLVGTSAIEDKLQDDVPETIARMLRADIKVWVLTGDKQETAIEIARSCQLIQQHMSVHLLNATTVALLSASIQRGLSESHLLDDGSEHCLVIDGATLNFVVQADEDDHLIKQTSTDSFVRLANRCKAVVVCRCSPMQKALIVELVREYHPGSITLAVGDGANDVSMIRAASVGIGIAGQEGMQAVRSSDFAIQYFRDLDRMLFFHGRVAYVRLAQMITYFFYKNIAFTFPLWIFGAFCVWSGQTFYDDIYITVYNTIFTVLPVFAFAIMEQDIPEKLMLRYPEMYRVSQQNWLFNYSVIAYWFLLGYVSAVIFALIPIAVLPMDNKNPTGFWFVSIASFTCLVFGVTVKIMLITRHWTVVSVVAYGLSFVFFFATVYAYDGIESQVQGVVPHVLGNGQFWLVLLLCVVIVIMLHFTLEGYYELFVAPPDAIIASVVKQSNGAGNRGSDDSADYSRRGSTLCPLLRRAASGSRDADDSQVAAAAAPTGASGASGVIPGDCGAGTPGIAGGGAAEHATNGLHDALSGGDRLCADDGFPDARPSLLNLYGTGKKGGAPAPSSLANNLNESAILRGQNTAAETVNASRDSGATEGDQSTNGTSSPAAAAGTGQDGSAGVSAVNALEAPMSPAIGTE